MNSGCIISTKDAVPSFVMSDGGGCSLVVYPRIHAFSLDLSVLCGIIKHGAFGFSLTDFPIYVNTRINSNGKDRIVSCGCNVSVLDYDFNLDLLRKFIGVEDFYDIEIKVSKNVREHIGLGCSTQIYSAVLLCCAKNSGINLNIQDLFSLGVGHSSTLGLNLVFNPGYIIETGVVFENKVETVSNCIYKFNDFPFYSIVGIPKTANSISGSLENDFWDNLLPDKPEESLKIAYQVFQNMVPGIVTKNFDQFISSLSNIVSMGTKPFETRIQPQRTINLLQYLKQEFGFAAVSSMGPSVYTFSDKNPRNLVEKLNEYFADFNFIIIKPKVEHATI